MPQTTITLVTNHQLFSECLRSALAHVKPDILLQVAIDEDEMLRALMHELPAVLIIDERQGTSRALQLIATATARHPDVNILALGTPQPAENIVAFLEAGATSFVSNDDSLQDFLEAIDRILRGEVAYSPDLASASFARLQELAQQRTRLDHLESMTLSPRELEVLERIGKGMPNKEIARELHLSRHTVKNHVHRILEKLEVHSRFEAVRHAERRGWLSLQS